MSWFRVDDDFHSHRKVQALKKGPCRDAALALWLRSGSYSSQANLGGFVPDGTADDFSGHDMAASELVRVNLWELHEGGYQFHDWEDYNPSGQRVEEKKRLARERKAKSRAKLSKPMSSDVAGSRVTVGDCIPVTRESRGGHAAVTHESLGDRERDLESSSSSSFFSSEILRKSTVDANSTVAAPAETVVVNFRRPVQEPPEGFEEECGPSDAELRRIAWESFRDGVVAVFLAPPGKPADKQLDEWIDQLDRTIGTDQFTLQSLCLTAAYNWASERRARSATVPPIKWMIERSAANYLFCDCSKNPERFRPVPKHVFDIAVGAAE